MKPARGFAQIIIVAVIVLLIGAGAILVYEFFNVTKFTPAVPIPRLPASVDETSNWKTYKSQKGNFEVKYPNDWIDEKKPGLGLADNNLDYLLIEKTKRISFTVNAEAEPSHIIYPFNAQDAKIITLAGEKAYFAKAGDAISFNKAYGIKRNGNVYRIDLTWDKNSSDAEGELDKILSTFKFTSDETANWKIYNYKKAGVYFKYPADWVETGSTLAPANCNAPLFCDSLDYGQGGGDPRGTGIKFQEKAVYGGNIYLQELSTKNDAVKQHIVRFPSKGLWFTLTFNDRGEENTIIFEQILSTFSYDISAF